MNNLMEFILKLKHWQIFILLIVGFMAGATTIEDNSILTTILRISGPMIYFLYPLLVGHALYQIAPSKAGLNYNFFLINSFIWLACYAAVMVISDGQGMKFEGLAALPGFYVFFAFIYYLMFPARVLRSIEKDRKVDTAECIGDLALIVMLLIGIWVLQPRINRVVADQERKQ